MSTSATTSDATKAEWIPPAKVEELFAATAGNKFSGTNRPTAGAREEEEMPRGETSFQFYSLATPNGQKPGILLEELGIPYDAHQVGLGGDQFKSGFVDINPNSKIPAAVDYDGPGGKTVKLFESVSIMVYLAKKHNRFYPTDPVLEAELMNWLFWQVGGQGPMTGAGFGHFFAYAPADQVEARNYGVARYGMEVQRLCSVLDNHLKTRRFMVGEEYTIADMAIFPWFYGLMKNCYNHSSGVGACTFLSVLENYPSAVSWAKRLAERPALQRGLNVCGWK